MMRLKFNKLVAYNFLYVLSSSEYIILTRPAFKTGCVNKRSGVSKTLLPEYKATILKIVLSIHNISN